MWKVSLKGVWAHKRRLFGTTFAVVLGVTFLVGTLVLGDTMRAGFNDLFTEVNRGTDAVVRNANEVNTEQGTQRGVIDVSLVDTIRQVDGVRAAEPSVTGFGQIVGKNGNPIGGNGPPTIAASWTPDENLNPWTIAEGNPPEQNGQVVIDKKVADDEDINVGDTITILTPDPLQVEVVGIVTIGGEDSLGAVTFAAFTFDQAQELFMPRPGVASEISVSADDGVSQEQLVENLRPVLPDGVEAITGEELTDENNQDINDDFLGFFEAFLLVFAGVALLVATFSIYNTFSILIAQRTRESALLRAIGASRTQVLLSIALEALAIGLVASILGLLIGIALAAGLRSLFDAAGFGVPTGAITVKTGTVIAAFLVGMVVTFLATVFPALRASRVPPLAALRDVAVEKTGVSPVRLTLGVLFTLAGVALVISAGAGSGDIGVAGSGAVLTIVGFVILGPIAARPAASVIGRPIAAWRRLPGRLARENAMRNPRRTAATASALMVGVAVVTLFTVFAASVKAAIDDTVAKQFKGDLVIASENFSAAGLSPEMTAEIAQLPEVAIATGQGIGTMTINGSDESVSNVEPANFARLLDLDVLEGSLEDLTDTQIAVSQKEADDRNFALGDTVTGVFPSDGTTQQFEIGAIYDRNTLAGNYVISKDAWNPHATQQFDIVVMIQLAEGVSISDGQAAVQQVADRFFAPDVQTRQEYVDSVADQINIFLTIVYALLVLAIIIALFGIANTLSLSVYERIRELGLLRAVGQTRSQLRSMVRWESVIIAVFGTIGGIVIGLFLGWGILEVTARSQDFPAPYTIPFGQIIGVLIVGAIVGVIAGWRPARRASKLDILSAIATE
jgi:putative ABC transport system permease protein